MMRWQISCFFLFGWTVLVAQCPTKISIWQTLEAKTQASISNEQLITSSLQLKDDYKRCNYQSDSIYAKILHVLGRAYRSKGDLKQAIAFTKQAIEINSQPGSDTYAPNCTNGYLNLLLMFIELSQEKQMLEALKKVVEYSQKYNERKILAARAYSNVSIFYYEKGDFDLSVKYAQIGQSVANSIQNSEFLVENFVMEAQALIALNKNNEAKITLQKATIILKNNKDASKLASIYSQIARIERSTKNYSNAVSYYKKAVSSLEPALKNNNDPYDKANMATFLNNIGEIYAVNLKNYQEAITFYKTAYQYTTNDYDAAQILANEGLVLRFEKKYESALQLFWQSFRRVNILSKTNEIDSNPLASTIKFANSKRILLGLIQDKADTWLDYYKTTKTKSHLTNALKTYALADSMIDFMRYEHAGEGSKLFWRQKTRGMYERAIEASYLAGDTEAAFRFFEKSKAVLLADKLNELGANQQLPEADAKRQRVLRDSIAHLQNHLASLPANDKKRQEFQARLERFNDDFELFRKNLEKTNPAYYRYKYDNSTPSSNEFRKHPSFTGEGTGFISYFVGDSAVYAFMLTAQQTKLVKLKITPHVYQSTAHEFLNLCANRAALNAQYPRYRALAYALYEQLWKPLTITDKHIIIAQDGVFLPFEALLAQPDENDFLLKHHAISYTYSANFLLKQPPASPWSNLFDRSFAGFAPETFQPSLRRASLQGSASALEEVGKKFWWGKLLKNTEATKARFMQYAPHSRVIQLFTHADADSTDAVEPRIYFHDAPLRLSELSQADRFDAQLLVLSACKTGIGHNQRGEGVFSLARGFAALGIPSTITTLWSVEDQPTYKLTKLFYKHLAQNLPKDEALQRAKLDWLAQGGAADALPSQWAGMILVGDTAPLSGFPLGIYGLVVVGLALLGGVWWWRKY
jgi:CHAT domain-containing protein